MEAQMSQVAMPILFRGIERLMICGGGIFAIYLGYKLYCFGVTDGLSKVNMDSKWAKFAASGSGPGLFLIFFGSMVMITGLWNGQGEWEELERKEQGQLNLTHKPPDINDKDRNFVKALQDSKQGTPVFPGISGANRRGSAFRSLHADGLQPSAFNHK